MFQRADSRTAWHPSLLVVASALVAILSTGCDSSPSESDPVAYSTVVQIQHSGISSARQDVIRDSGEWADLWREIHFGANPSPSRPAVDFSREMLVLAAMGAQPSGCYSNEIAAIRGSGGRLDVSIVESEPGPSCVCTQAITQPVHVVRVDRREAGVRFDTSRRTLSCS